MANQLYRGNHISTPPAKRINRRIRRLIISGGCVFLLAFILLNLGAALHAHRLTRFADYPSGARPVPEAMSAWDRLTFAVTGGFAPKSRLKAQPDFPFEPIDIITTTSGTLRGWQSISSPGTTATIILCHGHGATRSALLTEADFFRGLGLRVVMFDFRAHGESSGDVCSIGYHEAADVKAVYDYVRAAHSADHILLYGISMGAVASARAIAEYDLQPTALILEMPFNRLLDAVRARVRLMKLPAEPASSLLTFWGGVQLGFSGFDLATADYVKSAACPILLQWGTADQRVSKQEILAIKNAAPNGTLHLETYPGLGHSSLAKKANGQWTKNVHQWLSRNLPK